MRIAFALLALVGMGAGTASAQSSSQPVLYNVYGPYSVYGPGLTYTPPSYNAGPSSTSALSSGSYVRVGSVLVPDGGEALAAGYSSSREGRREAGTPVLGKVPYLGRGFNNVGYAQSARTSTTSVRVRIIRMEEEEERQTGVRR